MLNIYGAGSCEGSTRARLCFYVVSLQDFHYSLLNFSRHLPAIDRTMTTPTLIWDSGTAYDFFISLYTLHHPAKFGLRGSWAVGVRSRLPTAEREFLQSAMTFFHWPLEWVYGLPSPKDAAKALEVLEGIPAAQRLPALMSTDPARSFDQRLLEVADRGRWDEDDARVLQALMDAEYVAQGEKPMKEDFTAALTWWSRPEEFGEQFMQALRSYYEAFFVEDEVRIAPALQQALAHGQALAKKVSLNALLEELSQGVHFDSAPDVAELVLTPSFWGSPLLLYGHHNSQRTHIAFGARPADASIVPGEVVPDALFRALKALADPTRLRIMRYLTAEPLSPSELARRLRLRAPTVVHHLHTLRLAGLVHLTVGDGGKLYKARRDAVQGMVGLLDSFFEQP